MVRLGFIGFVLLTLVYVIVSIYSRSVCRGKLKAEFDEAFGEAVGEDDRDAFIRDGLKAYEKSFRRKLILGVYVVPILAVIGLVYVVNFM